MMTAHISEMDIAGSLISELTEWKVVALVKAKRPISLVPERWLFFGFLIAFQDI